MAACAVTRYNDAEAGSAAASVQLRLLSAESAGNVQALPCLKNARALTSSCSYPRRQGLWPGYPRHLGIIDTQSRPQLVRRILRTPWESS